MAEYAYPGRENLQAMEGAKNYNRRLCDVLLQSVGDRRSGQRILDFGAGSGLFARALRDSGVVVECLEPDEEYARVLREDGFKVGGGLGSLDGTYDAIYAINVLEHIEDDRRVFDELVGRLKPGGRIMIYVPAFGMLFSSMDRLVGHHRRYRASDLREYGSRSALTVSVCRYCDPMGFLASLLYRLVGSRSGTISSRAVKIYDRTAFKLGNLVEPLTGRLFGKNLLFVAYRGGP